jgi:RNA polymerase sigma factor (sigma-70 family)
MIKPPFEEMIPAAMVEINKRRNGWTLSSMAFEDVSQVLLIRAFNKYHTFEPDKGEFSHWINRLISNALINLLRDNLQKFSRPCVQGCQFNLGDNSCGYTSTGKQCEECPLYAKWKRKKEPEYNIKQGLSLDAHIQEVNNIQNDFIDIDEYKRLLDEKMPDYLTVQELRIYKLLFNEHKTPEEVGVILKFKSAANSNVSGYQTIHKARKKIVKMAKKIIFEEGNI